MAINFPINPSNGDTYVVGEVTFTYNATKSIWSSEIITDPISLSLSLNDITNVSSTSPTAGQVLSYDVTNTEWINTTPIDAYTKTEVDTAIGNVSVDLSGYDTSAQVDTKIAAIPDTDLSAYDTSAQVDTKVASIVDSAPETLNTLNELAAALGDDANHVATMTTLIGTKSDASHTHDYAPTVHTHDYAPTVHTHDYAPTVHTHDYAPTVHTHDYAPTAHTHDLSAYDTSSEVDAKIIANAGSSVVVSDTVPTNPSAGDLWTDSTNMRMFVYYVDSDSSQWVEVGSAITNNVLRTTLVKSGDLNIFTGTEKWYSVDSITFLDYNLFLGTAPVGNNLTVVINKNGVAVQTLVVASTQTSVTGISSFTMVPSDYITIDITSIGTDTTGSDLTLVLTYSVI